VWERGGSDVAVLDGSGTVVSQGFDWYMNQLETRTGRRRTEEDRAEATAAPEKFWEAEKKKKKIEVIQNLCSDTMLREKYYIESHVSCT